MSAVEWPEPPVEMMVVFCSACRAYLGIHDVDRMRHEHFEQTDRCRRGHYLAAIYEQKMLGTYSEALKARGS
jgi:hypothetical protein